MLCNDWCRPIQVDFDHFASNTCTFSTTFRFIGLHFSKLILNSQRYECDYFISTLRWFHGKITRDQAERLLNPPETGLFLVRESTNFPGDYTLCVSCDGKVEHYRIIYKNGKLTIDEEGYFENLMQLVEVRIYIISYLLNQYFSNLLSCYLLCRFYCMQDVSPSLCATS